MDLIKRTLKEISQEVEYVVFHMQRWWNTMDQGEQMFTLGIVGAALLLLGMRGQPSTRKVSRYDDGNMVGVAQQFLFAAVVLMIFTFGIDIAIQNVA